MRFHCTRDWHSLSNPMLTNVLFIAVCLAELHYKHTHPTTSAYFKYTWISKVRAHLLHVNRTWTDVNILSIYTNFHSTREVSVAIGIV